MRNEDMYDTNSLMFEISELRKKNEKLEADKKELTEQLALCSVVGQSEQYYCYKENHGVDRCKEDSCCNDCKCYN